MDPASKAIGQSTLPEPGFRQHWAACFRLSGATEGQMEPARGREATRFAMLNLNEVALQDSMESVKAGAARRNGGGFPPGWV